MRKPISNMPLLDGKYSPEQIKKRWVAYQLEKEKERVLNYVKTLGVYYPPTQFLRHSGFGGGTLAWSQYHIGTPNASQYMSPQMITGNPRLRNSTHYNLCGELAMIASLGVNLSQGMNEFASIPNGTNILNNNLTTSGYTLASFLLVSGGSKYAKADIPRNSYAIKDKDKMKSILLNGDIMIALVNIDTTRSGNLRSVSFSGRRVAHWVWVQAVHEYFDETFVRVYNPYMNREEVYSWETFMQSYHMTYGNTSQYLSVYAKRVS